MARQNTKVKSKKAAINFEESRKAVGYIPRKDASQADYDRVGFMSGLEVHQQLLTESKLFCRCPAGIFNDSDSYDAEVIRHMRPTLSELGEYDGTALMEFRTRKEITYRISKETACTYEVDDTPPFPIDPKALEISIEISLLSKLNIVGEVHITRKQYLDGSIPAGFQRTAIIGVEGLLPMKNKDIRLIQLSIEEDSCREISDVGHKRVYKTDRLGMPLIETVTYPDMVNPDEVQEVCDYIRFLNRSTGKVRTGIGAGRQDVNVSCKGGSRVEIKGVAHTKWIPELTHNEVFRQWALLQIRTRLKNNISKDKWKMESKKLNFYHYKFDHTPIEEAMKRKEKLYAVNLPGFAGILSYFTQPGKPFYDEFANRLKVIACIEKPNMATSEDINPSINDEDWKEISEQFGSNKNDAQIIFWGPEDDIKTALETIEERALMSFDGVPEETRKSFANGTTIFERVLPGADRMYPDTDSAPIPLASKYIDDLQKNIPSDIITRYNQLQKWGVPENTYTYIFSKNLFPIIEQISNNTGVDAKFIGCFFGYKLKFVEGHFVAGAEFNYSKIAEMFNFIKENGFAKELLGKMLPIVYENPKLDFESVLTLINFKPQSKKEIISRIDFLKTKFKEIRISEKREDEIDWIMGQLRSTAIGNIALKELSEHVSKIVGE